MMPGAPLFPVRATALAEEVDRLFWTAVGISGFFSALIALLLFYFGVRYRRRHPDEVGVPVEHGSRATAALEFAWSVIPLAILMFLFAWGLRIFFAAARPPADAAEFFVVGKQWMWKVQHPEGKREINELHVPLGRPVKLTMTSEDVIHSFYVPAFRIKQDVLPGRYTTLWFEADRRGTYHLFCAEFCGAEHSRMIGRVVVMEPHEYQEWLAGKPAGPSMRASGAELFVDRACNTCHRPDSSARAPILEGLAGREVRLQDGRAVTADEAYLRESILLPQAKIVAGYQPIMPTYKGQLDEEDLIRLITYLKGLGTTGAEGGGPAAGEAPGGAARSGVPRDGLR
jgi:cytochrome c oxidase subunit 2